MRTFAEHRKKRADFVNSRAAREPTCDHLKKEIGVNSFAHGKE
jgi:hypothetical protein